MLPRAQHPGLPSRSECGIRPLLAFLWVFPLVLAFALWIRAVRQTHIPNKGPPHLNQASPDNFWNLLPQAQQRQPWGIRITSLLFSTLLHKSLSIFQAAF